MIASRILVVDDSDDCRNMAEAMLRSAGYAEVISAGSAAELFDLLSIGDLGAQPQPLDLILLDVMMPGIDGIAACAHIRNDQRYTDLPILMVTGVRDMDSLANAFIAGANDYIMKPFNRIEILARVRSALKLKSQLDCRRQRERELLQFMSSWVDRRGSQWIDPPTGLFIGEVAEAYLIAASGFLPDAEISVIALSIHGLETLRLQNETLAREILAGAARIARRTTGRVGTIAAAYRSGVIVLIAPELPSEKAVRLAEALRGSVSALRLADINSPLRNGLAAHVSVITDKAASWTDGVDLLSRAMAGLPKATIAA